MGSQTTQWCRVTCTFFSSSFSTKTLTMSEHTHLPNITVVFLNTSTSCPDPVPHLFSCGQYAQQKCLHQTCVNLYASTVIKKNNSKRSRPLCVYMFLLILTVMIDNLRLPYFTSSVLKTSKQSTGKLRTSCKRLSFILEGVFSDWVFFSAI